MFVEPSMPERRPSPGLSLNLSSNNPFRNRAASPALPSPAFASPNSQQRSSSGSRPMSRNPFLSTFEAEFNKEAKKTDNLIDMSANLKDSPKKATFGTATEELFVPHKQNLRFCRPLGRGMEQFTHFASQFADYPALLQKNLTIEDEKKDTEPRRAPPPRPAPNRSATDSRGHHRPSRSDEEERDRMRGAPRGPPRPRGPPGPRPPQRSSPERREHRRQRRNSESSIIDRGSLDPNEERRRRERRREREERAKDGKSTTRRVRKPQGLDLIDKLDVTGIYGPSMIHHDGPYDAVQPHRNRKKDQRAPMEAFPLGSANNSLGGSGPLNSKIDLDRIHGRGAEGFTDFGSTETEWKKPRPQTEFSVKGRADIVHGEQTHGLGTSTFLEGAPASKKAIEQETEAQRQAAMADGGLGRKKSIAQRFRGISQPRRFGPDGARITSPEARYGPTSPNGPYSAGPLSQTKATEQNPFFDEYNQAYDAKGATIKTSEANQGPSSPGRNALQRTVTSDSIGSTTGNGESKPSGGFLNRVKSLKGGRRRPA
ncbi:Pal1-domain-containing protein [Setomelanomma holmii]|uniref:Pal1-domain-containing protein n=1 Tax=Setomelanomma holmii TaxID=210430 RepID=A0A9P4H964_9PLEO|nr:Pal1-domain-containing protein [Setomelanomma holmii]